GSQRPRDGFFLSASGFRSRDRRHLCVDRGRLHAGLADLADDQFRSRRIRHAAGILRAGGDERRRSVLAGGRDQHRGLDRGPRRLVQARGRRPDAQVRGAAAGDLHHRAVAVAQGGRQGILQFAGAAVPGPGAGSRNRHPGRGGVDAKPRGPCGRHRHRGGAEPAAQPDAARPPDAGDGAELHAGAHPRHPGRTHGALHVSHQCRARRHRLDPDKPDLPGEIQQRRHAGAGRFHRRHHRRLQPGPRRHSGRARQPLRRLHLVPVPRRLSARHSDRRHSAATAGPARPRRGAHNMKWLAAGAAAAAAIFALIAPLLLKPFGIYLISMWAVLTIAALGLNLTLGYAGQVSLAQGAFVGIGAYTVALLTPVGCPFALAFLAAGALCFAVGWVLGYPALRVQHHYLAFVTLAFSTLVFLVLRNEEWLTGGIYGINGVARPSFFGWSTFKALNFYYFSLGVLAAATWWMLRSPWGRAFVALRENPVRALSLGLDTRRYTLMAFAIGSSLG